MAEPKTTETTPEEKPHISPTQLGMYNRCGQQYNFRYIQGLKVPPGMALLKGSAVHSGAEFNFSQKIESGEDAPLNDMRDAAITAFNLRKADGYELSAEETSIGHDKVLGATTDSTIKLIDIFATFIAPRIQPVLVEEKMRVVLPNSEFDLLSIVDVVTSDGWIIDLKTGKRKKPVTEVDRSDQLSWLAMAYQRLYEKRAKGVALEVMVDTGKTCSHQRLESTRDEADYQVLLNKINTMAKAVKAGIFSPAEPGAWCCDPRYCGYAADCPYYSGRGHGA